MGFVAPPVNILADMQVEYAGLLMGAGTPFHLPSPWQFLDLPPVKSMDQARTWGDGSWSGPDFADVFLPTVPVEIAPANGVTFGQAVQAFRNAVTIQNAPKPLWVKLPGLPLQGIGAKVAQRSIPIDLMFSLGGMAAGCAVQWRCTNPVWQSLPRTVTLTPGAGISGLGMPLFATYSGTGTFLDYGTTTAGPSSGTLTNSGNASAWPYVSVTGPISGPFTVTIDGNAVTYAGSLNTGDNVTIDYRTGRANLSTGGAAPADRTYLLSARSFTAVAPGGSSTVSFSAPGGTCTVTTADLWR